MWPFTPRYITEARHVLHAGKKLLHYKRDLWNEAQIAACEEILAALKKAIRSRNREAIKTQTEALEKLAQKLVRPEPHQGLRENIEVFIVAIVLAAGIRAYFLQPFKIPTGSMQPTLYGVVGYPTDKPAPNILARAAQFAIIGRSWIDIRAEREEIVVALRERTMLNFFIFTDIVTMDSQGRQKTYTAFAPADVIRRDFKVFPGQSRYSPGEPIVQGYVDTGDQVFVDKMSYNFVHPKRGDVFVFRTTNIRGIAADHTQYYIKRLAGLPGDKLQIKPPYLYVNDKLAPEKVFARVMSLENGYKGYSNMGAMHLKSPDETFIVPPNCYFALGDNSNNSSDSRNWGIVPEQNVTGRGFIVYWPFTKRWGLIR